MSGKWFGPHLRSLLLLGVAVGVSLSPAVAKHRKLDPYTQYRNDPHSGAWLNREIARQRLGLASHQRHRKPPRIALPPVNDPTADTTVQDTQSETSIVDLNGGNLVAAFNDSGSCCVGNHFTGYAYSSNKGITWTDAGVLPAGASGDAGDPVLANDPSSGVVYLGTLAFTGSPAPIQIFKSTDLGHTFAAAVPAGGTDADKDWLAVDRFAGTGQHNLYVCYTEFGGSPAAVTVTRSVDFAATFSSPVVVSNTGQSQGCFLTVSPSHQVNVYYFRGTGTSNDIWTRHSTDQGATWTPEVLVAHLHTVTTNGDVGLLGGARTNSFPHAVVIPDVTKPYQYVVYNDFDPAAPGSHSDVWVVRSVDNGGTWSAPQRINDDPVGDQWMPTVAVTPTDQLMFGYYSRSNDSANLAFHRRGRLGVVNPDKTTTLYHSFQLGPDNPIVIGQDPVVNSVYMGDYDQIAAAGSVFSSVWGDNRLADAAHAHQPDVHFAQIAAVPPGADLGVTVTASPASINLGDNVTFTVTATASGGPANDVYLSFKTVSAGLVIRSLIGSGCENPTGSFAGCSLGPIASGTSKSVQVIATAVDGTGTRTFTASGTTTSRDSSTANNTGSTNVAVGLGSATTSVYSTGNIAVPIPDAISSTVPGVAIIPIAVPDQGTPVKVQARVRLNHTFDADLRLTLISPTGKSTILSNRRGGTGDNYGSGNTDCTGTFTVFDDLAPTSIVAGTAPFAGTFAPEELLSKTLLDPMDGTWKLKIEDNATIDTGTAYCARLDITRVP